MDLTEIILNVLKEYGATNKELAKKNSEIKSHITTTYDIKVHNLPIYLPFSD